jgi:hypothetical protein
MTRNRDSLRQSVLSPPSKRQGAWGGEPDRRGKPSRERSWRGEGIRRRSGQPGGPSGGAGKYRAGVGKGKQMRGVGGSEVPPWLD